MDESALIAKAQTGDREALGRLLEAHQGVCYAFALRLTRKSVDAEDVCQDAFLRAARDVAGWRPVGSFRSWLLSLVRHAHGDRADSERARKRREESLAMERKPHVTQSVPTGPAEQAELRRQIELSLERLDDRYRLPISLHYEQGLSYVEAAAALEVPEGTVATNIRRGLEELREMMSRAGYSAATPAAIAAALSQTQAAAFRRGLAGPVCGGTARRGEGTSPRPGAPCARQGRHREVRPADRDAARLEGRIDQARSLRGAVRHRRPGRRRGPSQRTRIGRRQTARRRLLGAR